MESVITVDNIRCYAYHGCMDEEAMIGSEFLVDVQFVTNIDEAIRSDNLNDTVDYVRVHDLVREEMKKRSRLIEHVAGRIADRMIKEPGDHSHVTVRVTKLNPPVNGEIGSASVLVSRSGNVAET